MKKKTLIILIAIVIALVCGYIAYDYVVLQENDKITDKDNSLNAGNDIIMGIYQDNDGNFRYVQDGEEYDEFIPNDDYHLIGQITCNENLRYVYAYRNNYAILKNEADYYLYNYKDNKLVFGPFTISENADIYMDIFMKTILDSSSNLIGISYYDNSNKLYVIATDKSYDVPNGDIEVDYGPMDGVKYFMCDLVDYNYTAISNDNTSYLIN